MQNNHKKRKKQQERSTVAWYLLSIKNKFASLFEIRESLLHSFKFIYEWYVTVK